LYVVNEKEVAILEKPIFIAMAATPHIAVVIFVSTVFVRWRPRVSPSS